MVSVTQAFSIDLTGQVCTESVDGALYGIERDIADREPEAKRAVRQARSRPLLNEFKAWLDGLQPQVLPKSLMGQAVAYALGQWDKLVDVISMALRFQGFEIETAALAHDGDAAISEPRLPAGVVQVVNDLVAAFQDGLDGELAGHRLPHPRDAPHLGEQLARAQQRLRGHAGVEGALAADQMPLDDRHLQARLAQTPCAHLARRARADDDHIEFSLAHWRRLSRPSQAKPVASLAVFNYSTKK